MRKNGRNPKAAFRHPGRKQIPNVQPLSKNNWCLYVRIAQLSIKNVTVSRQPRFNTLLLFMTELETRLLAAFKQLEAQSREREQQLTLSIADLTKRLTDGAGRTEILSSQVTALAARIERLQTILTRK